jgi:uncharacterized membrane protein YeiH
MPEALPILPPALDYAGVAVFALTGALAAARDKHDLVTFLFFAIVTGVGGGTLRDLLIGAPVFWLHDPVPIAICLGVAVLVFLTPRRWWPERALDWCDAIGLAAYAVYGAGKALGYGIPFLPAMVMGIVSATMGGIIRDVVAGVPSIILRPELYVTAAALASGLFVTLTIAGLPAPLPAMIAALAGFSLRAAAIARGLALPAYRE